METVCQACGYQRKPTDQAPEWECPACGKAYVKTSHPSASPLVIYPGSPSVEAGNGQYGRATPPSAPKETAKNKHGILIGVSFLLLIFVLPLLFNPSSASDMILHSERGFIALICTAMLAALVVAGRMSERGGPDDRKSAATLAATSIGLAVAVLFFGIAISSHNEARAEASIQRNGVRATADVVRIYNGGCGRAGCNIYVEYAFTPPTETQSVHGHAWLGSTGGSDSHIAYARTNRQVPIAYEIGHPEVSALNFNDDVFRLDHDDSAMALLGKILLGILLLALAVVILIDWLRSSKKPNAV
ncbi:hypothetical protein [Rhodanobacter sp. DHB23]|uniref:hypothetical protein n=1 Tax=Rhodanobacter sp. DHB23 TaxID=2775923 RepID=UPI00177C951D|nr:hypothetical protein [Rhodanobacter sp. DHB23]MBD8873473.1 hypothetical protein [Rhodanobacter sp. DHB23]